MQAKLEAVTYAQREPIAVIGIGCRFPGGADSPESFWQLLEQGVDAIGPVPPQRWDADAYYDADPDAPGKIYTREGGFLPQIDDFDAPFFGISAREASSLDPQQRLLLEISWEALEHANQASERAFNSTTGVFIGICSNDYNKLLWELGGAAGIDAFCATGNALSLAAGRLSYALGLKGPSLVVDTACSSSLVALHLACQHLRSRECDLALAGGVNLLLTPDSSIAFSRTRMLDPSGRCKTFDASANGYVRGEGGGVVVLKRLSDAQKDGDHILAVVRGSAVNHNGRSSSLVAPNGPAQQSVIQKALEMSGVEPHQVDFVEVQGTGTAVGQSLEVGAITNILGAERNADTPLYVGSVKTNFGHLEGASGIASLIKTVLALQHQTIPAHLHFQQPNPHINWKEMAIKVPTQAIPWPKRDSARAAGVNCFGFSGTNAHVILSEPPAKPAPVSSPTLERPLHVLALSAKNPSSLRGLAESFHRHLEDHPHLSAADVCFSANTGRSHFQHRLALATASTQELSQQLMAFLQQQSAPMVWAGEAKGLPKLALAFPGAGAYLNMGRKLYDTQPVFRTVLDRCQELLQAELPLPLLQFLYPTDQANPAPVQDLAMTEPGTRAALFAVEYGLYQLWKSWGVEPALLLGEGIGEYVAATAAGVFSLEAGLRLSLEAAAIPASFASPRCPIGSLSTGEVVTEKVTQAEYWRDRPTVAQSQRDAAEMLSQQSIAAVLLLGTTDAVATTVRSSSPERPWLASLKPDEDWQTLLASLATLYTLGTTINWVGFDRPYPRQSLPLPTYAWRRQRYWFDASNFDQPSPALFPQFADANSSALAQQLATTGDLSEAELALVPKLLSLLANTAANGAKTAQTSAAVATSTLEEPELDLKTVTQADIQSWLVNRIAHELGVAPEEINPKAPFDSYGLDSVLAIGIASAGKKYLGVEVTPLMLIHHPSIEALSIHLAAEFEASGTEVFEL
ncbi:beta-ketoacyl synthase [filamentous cyanobacterium CCP3]|nr:beta-ketoacyl synthase [filamentous cyanobacterium CCP3]